MEKNFKSELAEVVRKNVKDLMKLHDLGTIKVLAEFVGDEVNYQRMNNAFGRSPRYAPTQTLIGIIEKAFGVEEGSLTKKSNEETIRLPSTIVTQVPLQCQLGNTKIETTVDAQTARQILELIVLGEKT